MLQSHKDDTQLLRDVFYRSLSSNIQDQEFKSFHLVGFNSLELVAGILTNTNSSGRLEENKNMHKDNSRLWTGAGTTKHPV